MTSFVFFFLSDAFCQIRICPLLMTCTLRFLTLKRYTPEFFGRGIFLEISYGKVAFDHVPSSERLKIFAEKLLAKIN